MPVVASCLTRTGGASAARARTGWGSSSGHSASRRSSSRTRLMSRLLNIVENTGSQSKVQRKSLDFIFFSNRRILKVVDLRHPKGGCHHGIFLGCFFRMPPGPPPSPPSPRLIICLPSRPRCQYLIPRRHILFFDTTCPEFRPLVCHLGLDTRR